MFLDKGLRSLEPYPGLRSFYRHEVDIFFGRDDHVDEMIRKLDRSHFVCITGPSGCGKSSLARTGLMNGLEAGFLPGTGSNWLFIDIRPGAEPLLALIAEFAAAIATDGEEKPVSTLANAKTTRKREIAQLLQNHVTSHSHNLVDAINLIEGMKGRPVLILVDQFEELFRYAQREQHAATKFVDIILQTAAAERNIYVAITIRTDELEKCTRYPGLTAAINHSQFLTPTLDRFQVQEAIEGPLAVFGGHVHPDLSIWLLNSTEDEVDKLPLLQHALRLLYRYKLRTTDANSSELNSLDPLKNDFVLELSDFWQLFAFGGDLKPSDPASKSLLRKSLSNQLDTIYRHLPFVLQLGAQHLFCALTDIETSRRDIRHPSTVGELVETTNLSRDEMWRLIKAFMKEDSDYLTLRDHAVDADKMIVDVPHECILRLWDRLQNDWLPIEQTNADNIRFLAELAKNYDKGLLKSSFVARLRGDNLLRGWALRQYSEWFDSRKPTATWASRYLKVFRGSGERESNSEVADSVFNGIKQFLDESKLRIRVIRGLSAIIGLVLVLGTFAWATSLLVERNQARAKLAAALSLYDPPVLADLVCENRNGFCARINDLRASLPDYQIGSAKPICPGSQFRQTMERVVNLSRTDCEIYPAVTLATIPVSRLSGTDAAMYRGILPLLRDPQMVPVARRQFQEFAGQHPNTSGIFGDLARAYQEDPKIADARRFSEAGACYMRSLDLACADRTQVLDLYYVGYGLSSFYEQYKLPSQTFLVLAGLSSSLLAEEAIALERKDSSHSRLLIERLWRGGRASVDAARRITEENGCIEPLLSNLSATNDTCNAAKEWYARGVGAFASMLEIAAAGDLSPDERERMNEGVGVAALYWGEDPIFRTMANGAIQPTQLIAELKIASEARLKPRYFADLAMIYCLTGDFHNSALSAEKILSKDQKDMTIKERAARCATSPDRINLFTVWTDIGD